MGAIDLAQNVSDEGNLRQLVEAEQFRAQAVVDVVRVIRDVVGDRSGLGLRARIKPQRQILPHVVFGNR